ncbi:MAG: HAMP domain-containing protein [Deltaproteobacteria bacterium]|nr:HAMP domain-containing protein [Deltaproteobacteria bacterium]MDQ3299853.1 ATP-binding protein [Myxococcota bacterium]
MSRRKTVPLQVKLTFALVLIVLMPLAMSAYFIGQLGKAAANVAAGEASARTEILGKSIETYHDLVSTTKDLHREIAARLARRPDLIALAPASDLEKLVHNEPGLRAVALVRPDGTVAAEASRPLAGPMWRDKVVDEELVNGGTLRLTFEVSATLNDDLQKLKQSIDATRTFVQIKSALPGGYRTAFLVLIGMAGLVAAGLGLWASRSVLRRIDALVSTARRVSDGHLDARVELRGQDEMAELGSAFNTMLDDLDQTRQQLQYLQRMGVWQDVARRLAHEIKNPLTPIQLAVQQCVSAYKGADTDPVRFKKLLADAGEIVEEEIEGLRRLVDTFRTLGALPKVEAAPLALAEVIEELKLDPMMATRLTLDPPAEPLTVRADKLLLKRVLVNLVENAIHAGQEAGNPGNVVIGWRSDPRGDSVAITVDDHGKGVAPESRDKIFEPYVTTKATGTGLGLAIARKIAIEHGGELSIAAERAPTGGARFVMTLPLRAAESSLA